MCNILLANTMIHLTHLNLNLHFVTNILLRKNNVVFTQNKETAIK